MVMCLKQRIGNQEMFFISSSEKILCNLGVLSHSLYLSFFSLHECLVVMGGKEL